MTLTLVEDLIRRFAAVLGGLPPEGAVFVVAALPIVELRAAIPLGVALGMDPWEAMFIALPGNLLPIPFILLGLEPVTRFLRRRLGMQRAIDWIYRRTRARSGTVRRYGWWGLMLLVALPLPGTGAWTGAAVASFLGYRFRPAMLALSAGTVLAALIVTVLILWSMAGSG